LSSQKVVRLSSSFALRGGKNPRNSFAHFQKEDISKLIDEQKAARKAKNKEISSVRMKIKHVIGRVKNFKIVAGKYRNRRKRLLLRFNPVCGIVNFERALGSSFCCNSNDGRALLADF
jgi:hypothetical protein